MSVRIKNGYGGFSIDHISVIDHIPTRIIAQCSLNDISFVEKNHPKIVLTLFGIGFLISVSMGL